jgi:hypothetical protein
MCMGTSDTGIMYVVVHRHLVGPSQRAFKDTALTGVPSALSMEAHVLSAEPRLAATLAPGGERRTCRCTISPGYVRPPARLDANPPPSEQPEVTQAPPPVADDHRPRTWTSRGRWLRGR